MKFKSNIDYTSKKILDTPIAYTFLKLRTAKDAVRKMSKKPGFRTSFDSQHAKEYQTLLNYRS